MNDKLAAIEAELVSLGESLVSICFELDDARNLTSKLENEGRELAKRYTQLKTERDKLLKEE